MLKRAHRALLADMREALLGELGAVESYRGLARQRSGEQVGSVLAALHEEELEQIARLREVMRRLGGRPRRGSLRRRLAARGLVLGARVFGLRFALRVCQEAEGTIARWYREHALHLLRIGELELARECDELAQVKYRHALTLRTWVDLTGS